MPFLREMLKNLKIQTSDLPRADVFIAEAFDITRSFAKRLCDDGSLKVNGIVAKSNKKLKFFYKKFKHSP